jgi:hypothetical protein
MAALTTAQLQTLKASIAASEFSALPKNADSAATVAAAYNLDASPDFWVWRTSVTKSEFVNSTSGDGTTFNWTGTGFIGRSQGERDAWREIFNGTDSCNPSLANVRQAFADIFSGATAPAPANRTHLLAVARRRCSRAERLYTTGTGSTASPAVMGWEGTLGGDDVQNAWNS